jgi:hypothetical protein
MNAKPLLFAFLLMVCCNPASAAESKCPAYVEPEITLTPIYEEPQHDDTKDAKALTELHAKGSSLGDSEKTVETVYGNRAEQRSILWVKSN